MLQSNALLISKVKTFKEISLDFLAPESSVYHFDMPNALETLYSAPRGDVGFSRALGRRLAHLCITLNEHPSIRYQGSSPYAAQIATTLHETLQEYKQNNPHHWTYGDGGHSERDRAQILILDRSFDVLSPLMHEYTYQAMVNDLLDVDEGVISYETTTNTKVETKQGVLGENDELWVELRHEHIAKVIEVIKNRMNDIIQNNSGAALAKAKGSDMDITTMAAAVKKLPEYTQTMTKLSQHVAIAQQCMNAFGAQNLLELSQIEQTISTGRDEDGNPVNGKKLLQLVCDTLSKSSMKKEMRVRLMSIYYVSQLNLPGSDANIAQAMQAARLTNSEQSMVTNFSRLLEYALPVATSEEPEKEKKGGILGSFFGGKAVKHEATPEGEYADTRHVCLLKTLLEKFLANQLPADQFPSCGPAPANSGKAAVKSVRTFGKANDKFMKKGAMTGVRSMVFVAGGVAYPELRVCYELMQKELKEVIVGGTHLITPDSYGVDVGALTAARKNMI